MAKEFIQAISKRYDELAGQQCCLSCGGAINYAEVQKGYVCADLGSGKGYDVLKMATMATETGFAYGIDVSGQMMDTARENARKLNLNNTSFIKCELENILLNDNSLDLVLSNCTLNHSLDQARVWQQIHRILKPGGSFVISDIYSLEPVDEQYRNDPEAVAQCWAGAVTREQYFNNIRQAGFERVEIIEESAPYVKGEINVCSMTIKGMKSL